MSFTKFLWFDAAAASLAGQAPPAPCSFRPLIGQFDFATGDGGPAARASVWSVRSLVYDRAGNLYFADSFRHRVRRVDRQGIITTVAGTGVPGFAGDGGPASAAQLSFPAGLAFDAQGNLLIADRLNNRVRRVSTTGQITTIAGTGGRLFNGHSSRGSLVNLNRPASVAADGQNRIYIADTGNNLVRRLDPDGSLTTVAGDGSAVTGFQNEVFYGDGGPARQSPVMQPQLLAVDRADRLYIVDSRNSRIRRLDANGTITTVAGNGDVTNGLAFRETERANTIRITVRGINFTPTGELQFSGDVDFLGSGIWTVDTAGGLRSQYNLTGSPYTPSHLAYDPDGRLVFVNGGTSIVATPDGRSFATVIPPRTPLPETSGPATERWVHPSSNLVYRADGTAVYVTSDGRVVSATANGQLTVVSPTGAATVFQGVRAVGLDSQERLVALRTNTGSAVVLRLERDGTFTQLAGQGSSQPAAGGLAVEARFPGPMGLAVAREGGFYLQTTLDLWYVDPTGRLQAVNLGGRPERLWSASNGDVSVMTNTTVERLTAAQATVVLRRTIIADAGPVAAADGTLYYTRSGWLFRVQPNGQPQRVLQMGLERPGGPGVPPEATVDPGALSVSRTGDLDVVDVSNQIVWRLNQPGQCPGSPVSAISSGGVVSAASFRSPDVVAPGQLIAVFGTGLGPAEGEGPIFAPTGLLASHPDSVLAVGPRLAPILFRNATQIVAVVPYAGGQFGSVTPFYTERGYLDMYPNQLTFLPANPAVFTADGSGDGQAAALNQDGSANSALNPATAGSIVVLYVTGLGQTDPPGVDGQITGAVLPRPVLPVSVTIGGAPAVVEYVGNAPALVAGVSQINVRVPPGLPTGAAAIDVIAGGRAAADQQRVTIAVR